MKVNDLLSLTVADVALGGRALARYEGRVVFLDRGLPGDVVEARVTRLRRNFVEAGLGTVVRPSPARVAPPCPHEARCGGCRFQDLAYPEQLALKERQLRDTLARIGGIPDPPLAPIVPSPDLFRYRNKMEFSFHPGPTDDGPVLGLHERQAFDRVFPLETCLLPSELTVAIVRHTARFARERRWIAYDPRRHEGTVRHLSIRHLPLTGACAVHLVASSDDVPDLGEWARGVAALSPEVRSVTLLLHRSRANLATGEEERVLAGDAVIVERLLGLEFEVTANAFLQTNSRQAELLYAAAVEAAGLTGGESVLDLYCGTGTLTLLMARATGGETVGVESVPDAVERARRNAARNGMPHVRFVDGEARRVLREWARGERAGAVRPRVVVVDPPRAGLHPRVVARIAELEPERVVYVSCGPATLARDLRDFAGRNYVLAAARPFDMFPHTPHIECVARLERRDRR